jgi:flavodoxin
VSTAAVVYRSRTGVTRRLAEDIAVHLGTHGIETRVGSVADFEPADLAAVDLLLLGCWTSGLLVVRQHPDEPWLAFVRDLPGLSRPRVALFTTYRIATGSMFARMRAALAGKVDRVELELKSRDGRLDDAGRARLDRFIGRVPA